MPIVEPARLGWRDGRPYAEDFRDIYHSADGPGEVRRVFLEPAGFTALLARRPRRLLVGELGFGTGLNFAVIAAACCAARVPLHFVSFEAAPIAPSAFREIAGKRRGELPVYDELDTSYPPLVAGWHRRSLAGGLVTLSLFWGDALAGLEQVATEQRRPFHLWLLDGFAPDRNPEMWQPRLFQLIASVSGCEAAVTTFTAAGRVRRALTDAGFTVRRVDQRPHKRESLAGRLTGRGLEEPVLPRRVDVVGAGLAGASVARHLALAGISVRVLDVAGGPGGASAIPATVLHARLLAGTTPAAALRAHAYLYAASCAAAFGTRNPRSMGVLQVPSANYPPDRLDAVATAFAGSGDWLSLLEPAESRALSGLPLDVPTLHFPDARVIDTPALCTALLRHPDIEVAACRVDAWPPGTTVLACAAGAREFPGAAHLELTTVDGQVDAFEPTAALADLPVAIVGNGYVAPTGHAVVAGATYEYRPWEVERATAANTAHLTRLAGAAAAGARWRARYRGGRCVTSDRLPVAGMLEDEHGEAQPERWVSTGHGSMGTVTSHYSAALIAAAIGGDFLPATPDITALLAPVRFRRRQARRGYRFGASP